MKYKSFVRLGERTAIFLFIIFIDIKIQKSSLFTMKKFVVIHWGPLPWLGRIIEGFKRYTDVVALVVIIGRNGEGSFLQGALPDWVISVVDSPCSETLLSEVDGIMDSQKNSLILNCETLPLGHFFDSTILDIDPLVQQVVDQKIEGIYFEQASTFTVLCAARELYLKCRPLVQAAI